MYHLSKFCRNIVTGLTSTSTVFWDPSWRPGIFGDRSPLASHPISPLLDVKKKAPTLYSLKMDLRYPSGRVPIFSVITLSINKPFLIPNSDVSRFDLLKLQAYGLRKGNTTCSRDKGGQVWILEIATKRIGIIKG